MKSNRSTSTFWPVVLCAAGFILLPFPVARGASVLWADADWPAPSPGPVTQHVVAGVEGGDVTWTFGGATGTLDSLGDSGVLTGGSGAVESLGIEWSPTATSEQITLDIDFSHPYGVTGVTMSFFDIDRDNKKAGNAKAGDRIIVTATTTTGTIIYPTFSSLGSEVQVVAPGTLIGVGKVNPGSGDGNATITFAGDIDSITIVFSDQGVGRFRAGELHDIGIDGVTFVPLLAPIPEPDPRALLVLVPLIFLFVRRRRLSRFRR